MSSSTHPNNYMNNKNNNINNNNNNNNNDKMNHSAKNVNDLNNLNNSNDKEIKEREFKKTEIKIEPQQIEETEDMLEDWQILKQTIIDGNKCKLVPYTKDHVEQYNKWLNDPYIQQMTQTEPYSLEQEYEYQQEWNYDDTKYIFIILDKTLENAMAGDINLFIQDEHIGELNIMIAEDRSRRKGLATETLTLIIEFAKKNLEIKQFIAKIQNDNIKSIKLFKKMGFKQTEYVETFKEYTFALSLEEKINVDQKKKLKHKLNEVQYTD